MRRMIPHSEWEKLKKAVEEVPDPVTVDSELSGTSENPVQNKVINTALADKQSKLTTTSVPNNDVGYLNTLIGFDSDGNLKKQAPQSGGGGTQTTVTCVNVSADWTYDEETYYEPDYYQVITNQNIVDGCTVLALPNGETLISGAVEDGYNDVENFYACKVHVAEIDGTNHTATVRAVINVDVLCENYRLVIING